MRKAFQEEERSGPGSTDNRVPPEFHQRFSAFGDKSVQFVIEPGTLGDPHQVSPTCNKVPERPVLGAIKDPRLVTALLKAIGFSSILKKVLHTVQVRTDKVSLSLGTMAAACSSSGTKSSIIAL